jgi:hypothetical protein
MRGCRVIVIGHTVTEDGRIRPQKSEYHRGFASRFGISRLMSVQLAPSYFLALTRAHEGAPFEMEELRFLQALTPHVQRASRCARW